MTSSATANGNGTKYAFDLPRDIWDEYIKYRPPYPDSMYKMWLDYHNGPLNTMHDLGTGCGVGGVGLLRVAQAAHGTPIPHAIFSDPSASNVETTRGLLTGTQDAPQQQQLAGTRFEFHQQPGEATFLAPGSVDMVIACECLHWTQIDTCAASVHASLRPGGTFASVMYDPSSGHVPGDDALTEAFRAVYADTINGMRAGRHQLHVLSAPLKEAYFRKRTHDALNIVPLGADRWADATRVYINIEDGQKEWPKVECMRSEGDEDGKASRVDEASEKLVWLQDTDSWSIKDCTVDWIRGMLRSSQIELNPAFWTDAPWTELVAAAAKKGGKFNFALSVNYIMARKK